MKHIYFTVTNELSYDQRMQRICNSLALNGYAVTLVGRKLHSSPTLKEEKFIQKRIGCLFNKGKLFYVEYNFRLFLYLLFRKMDATCAIDLDTIIPCYFISRIKRIPRIYDAHELFTELKEVITRPLIKKTWTAVEKRFVPKFKYGYTVSEGIVQEFQKRYNVNYETIRNVPVLKKLDAITTDEKFILYQGAVNEGRAFEYLIPAMQWVNYQLIICGDGNFMPQLKKMISKYSVENKIEIRGMLPPDKLWSISQQATVGISLAEKEGLNQYLALPNKFFDYIHACLPQITMDYPEYRKINNLLEVGVLINDLRPEKIAHSINNLIENNVILTRLKENCKKARLEFNWQNEEKKLLSFYKLIFEP